RDTMSFRDIAAIAGSAMSAHTERLNTVGSNLANAQSASRSEEPTYRARKPVFASVVEQGLGEDSGHGASVLLLDVVQGTESVRGTYEPDNPRANEAGDVFYPNVNPVAEMTDMMSASRAFETNVEVMGRVKSMQNSLLRLGEN